MNIYVPLFAFGDENFSLLVNIEKNTITEFRDEDMMKSWPGGIIDAELSHWRHVH